MDKSPADNFVFVSIPNDNLILFSERGDIHGDIVAVGNKVNSFNVASVVNGKPSFKKGANVGERACYRYESLRTTFKNDGKKIGIIPISEVKYVS